MPQGSTLLESSSSWSSGELLKTLDTDPDLDSPDSLTAR